MNVTTSDKAVLLAANEASTKELMVYYTMWMDVHVMIFIGFGFLMAFLRTHSYSSIGFNFLCACWAMQCCILFQGFWSKVLVHGFHENINVTIL
jgi:hypothetical protein